MRGVEMTLKGVLILGLIAPGIASAKVQTATRYSHEYNICMHSGDAAKGVDPAMMDCTRQEIDRQNDRLNQTYKRVLARLDTTQKVTLRAIERAWISKRDSHCQKESASEEGGTLANLIYSGCILDETIKQTIWLETYKS